MPNFTYTGFAKSGKSVKGTKDASSKQAALAQLAAEGLLIDDIQEQTSTRKGNFLWFFSRKKNMADLFFQLSLLLRSGIPLVNALEIITRSTTNKNEKAILSDVSARVSEGMRFSEALSRHEEYFTGMYVNLIRASENVGRLAQVLMDIAEYEESKKQNRDKLTSALIYPTTVLVLGFGVLAFMLTVIVPKMQGVFDAAKQEIPASTKALLAIAAFSKQFGLLIVIFLIFCILLLRYLYTGNSRFRMWTDKKLYSFALVSQSAITRFSHILAFQLKEGLPLTDALRYANLTVQNVYMRKVLDEVRSDVQSGVKFSASVKNAGIFPELFPAAVTTGESSGNMPELLERVNEFYGKKIDKLLANFLSILEPAFIVIIGVMVAFIVISIMQPLFSMNTMVG
jgi:type II secretory pathway component PulF